MNEIWKSIDEYEGFYEVSSLGRIRSLPRVVKGCHNSIQELDGKVLKQKIKDTGYCMVCLSKDGKSERCYVHRLVAKAFIPNPDGLPEVNHKDEDKANNIVANLEWCSHTYNNSYGSKTKRATLTRIKNGNGYLPEEREVKYKEKRKSYYQKVKNNPDRLEKQRLAMQRYRMRKKLNNL